MNKLSIFRINVFTFICLVAFTDLCLGQANSLNIKFKQALDSDPQRRDISWLSENEKELLIEQAKAKITASAPAVDLYAVRTLVVLGDEATIERLNKEAKSGNGLSQSMLLDFGGESELKYLADTMYHGSLEYPKNRGDIQGESKRGMAVFFMYCIIARSTSFPASTRNWAHQMMKNARAGRLSLGPDGVGTKWMHLWWEQNKEAVLSHKYSEATWLPDLGPEKALPKSRANINPAQPSLSSKQAAVKEGENIHFPAEEGNNWILPSTGAGALLLLAYMLVPRYLKK